MALDGSERLWHDFLLHKMIWKNRVSAISRTNRVGSSNVPYWFVAMAFVMYSEIAMGQQFITDQNGIRNYIEPLEKQKGPVRLSPRTEFVPANFLKFYLTFPEKMERGVAFENLTLHHQIEPGKTKPVLEPFREVELWDETGTRLTLWLHPGRQKPGVNLNVEFGPILESGKQYKLVVSDKWKTEKGEKLEMDSTFYVRAIAPVFRQPKPHKWELNVSRKQVSITPCWSWNPRIVDGLDAMSFAKRITVRDAEGKNVPVIADGDSLTVSPLEKKPFSLGKYQLVVDSKLENLAGNSVARPFNVDLEKNPDFKERTEPVFLDFEVKAD